ncbi:hypothetical protein KDN24_16400 [Bacillus sp. Bva_UNVM-123]|uniref:hypothetical protein n=1 Tax=Bacillus sp. Bva_UNVM-123 TaxID=2829798 RepID=UPI00391F3DDD
MNSISRLAAAFKEDVNNEESMFVQYIYKMLNNMFKLIILFGIPFVIYLLFQLSKSI